MIHQVQGDVMFLYVEAPKDAKWERVSEKTVAYGEVTGHSHRVQVADPDTELLFAEVDGKVYMNVQNGRAKVVHEEHGTQTFEPGFYQVITQIEYDETQSEKYRQVMD